MAKRRDDDFSAPTKNMMSRRVGYVCSNPDCRRKTSGPKKGEDGAVNIGVAAHITAASNGGPRYDSRLTSDERKSIENGIWLCQTCSTLIDRNPEGFPVALLKSWKQEAEESAMNELLSENRILRKEIDELLSAIEGRDAFGMVVPSGFDNEEDGSFWIQFYFGNQKDTPIYDVSLNWYDPEEVQKHVRAGKATKDAYGLYSRLSIGTMGPRQHFPITAPAPNPDKGYFHYIFHIGARSQIFKQEIFCIALASDQGAFLCASKVFQLNLLSHKYRLVKEIIMPGFPEEKISWSLDINEEE